MALYVLVEGHGEQDAVQNLLTRLNQDLALGLPHVASPIRALGIEKPGALAKYAGLVRAKRDADAMLVLHDDEDGCPAHDGPAVAARLRELALPFPAAVTLAYREYESLFLPCIHLMAGVPLPGPGGNARVGLKSSATYVGDFEAKRGVKEWLTSQMPQGKSYKPSLDQLALTRMVNFEIVRRCGLPWFGTLERALKFLSVNLQRAGVVYP